MKQTLDEVRTECREVHASLAMSRRKFHLRRRSLQAITKSIGTRWVKSGPHTPELNRQFAMLFQGLGNMSTELAQMTFRGASTSTSLMLELLEPESLDSHTKIEYANRILAHLRRQESERLSVGEEFLDQFETAIEETSRFIEVNISTEGVGAHLDEEVSVNGIDLIEPSGEATIESDDDASALGIEVRDEFLDDSKYRRIAKTFFLMALDPIELLVSEFASYGETQKQFQLSLNRWHSTGPHSVDQERWVIEHLNVSTELSRVNSSVLKQRQLEAKRLNRAFLSSLELDPNSATAALGRWVESLNQYLADLLSQLRSSFQAMIGNYQEMTHFINDTLEPKVSKKRPPFWKGAG